MVIQLPKIQQRKLLNISMIEKKLSVGKGELALFPAPNVIGFPWFRNTLSIIMNNDRVCIRNFPVELIQYNLDQNIRLGNNYNKAFQYGFQNYH